MVTENKINSQISNLYNLARQRTLPHALLFESTSEIENLNASLGIAKSLVCFEKCSSFCGNCENCKKIEKKVHPDVRLIMTQEDKTRSIKIDDIRNLRQDAYIAPNEGDFKVYIITDGDYITTQAQNAIIKILEEPPKNVIFIILCTSILNLLQTIRSRSQHFIISEKYQDNQNEDSNNLAENIANCSVESDKFKIMELISKIPHDRFFLKKLLNNIVKIFIRKYAEDMSKSTILLKKIDGLRYIIKIIDNNINFNLLMCCLSANL